MDNLIYKPCNMRKIVLFTMALAVSSVVFSQTENNGKQQLNINKNVTKEDLNNKKSSTDSKKIENKNTKAPRDNNSEYCASCPKSETNVNTKTVSLLPSDFPVFVNTGNKKQDLANFHNAKQKWIKENPERFKEIQKLNLNESIPTDL